MEKVKKVVAGENASWSSECKAKQQQQKNKRALFDNAHIIFFLLFANAKQMRMRQLACR